jgi:hypothetical protein
VGRAPKRQQKNRTLRVQRSSAPMRRTHRVPLTHHANGPQSGQGRAQALGQLGELRGVKQPQFSTQHPSPPNWVTSTHAATHCPQRPGNRRRRQGIYPGMSTLSGGRRRRGTRGAAAADMGSWLKTRVDVSENPAENRLGGESRENGPNPTPVGAVNLPNGTLFQAFRAYRAGSTHVSWSSCWRA